jgi:hypothetical protein
MTYTNGNRIRCPQAVAGPAWSQMAENKGLLAMSGRARPRTVAENCNRFATETSATEVSRARAVTIT